MRVRSLILGTAGGLLLLASFAHSFGWSQFDAALAGVDANATAGLRVGWIWGSFAFAAYGGVEPT